MVITYIRNKKDKQSNGCYPKNLLLIAFISLFFGSTPTRITAQTLHDYLQEALTNNPELKALEYTYEIAKTKPEELNGLGDTRFGLGYFVSEPETRTGAQKARFSMQQKLPIMGVVRSQKKEALAAIAAEKNRLEITKRKLLLQLKKNYYELYALKRKSLIIESQKKLLKNYHETALSALENNKISAVAILKIKIAQNSLQQKEEIFKGAILNTEKAFNILLNRDGFEELVIPQKLAIPEEEPTMALDEITYHPEALQFDYADTIVEKKRKTNALERLPSFSIGLDYVIVEERPNLDFDDNGKDIIMPMISFAAPIFSKKQRTKAKQYGLAQEGLQQQRKQTENMLSQRLETAINDRITARIVYDTQQKNITQTKHAEEMLLTSYQTGIIDFDAILELQEMLLDFEFEQIESVKEYFIQTAIINYML